MREHKLRDANPGEERETTAFKMAKARMKSFSAARREASERLNRDGDAKLFPDAARRSGAQGSKASGNSSGEPRFPAPSSDDLKRFTAHATPALRTPGRSEEHRSIQSSSADEFDLTPLRDIKGMGYLGYPGDPPIPKNASWLHDLNVTSLTDQRYAKRTYYIPVPQPMTAGFHLITQDEPRGSAWSGVQASPNPLTRTGESLFTLAEAATLGGGTLAKRGVPDAHSNTSASPLPREITIHVRVDRKNWEEPLKDLVLQVAMQLMKEGYLRKPNG